MRFRRRTRTRERTEWVNAQIITPTIVAVNTLSVSVLLTQAALEEWPGGRIDRLLLSMFISPATAPAAATGYGVFIGLSLVQLSGGTPNTYDPELQPEHRWLWTAQCFPQIGGTGAADQNAARWAGYFPLYMDRKIRRRPQEDEQLSLFVKNSSASGASIQYSFAARLIVAAGRK